MTIKGLFLFLLMLRHENAIGQVTVNLSHEGDYYYPFTWPLYYSGLTPVFDKQGRDFLYLASMELGMVTFDISDPTNPVPVDTMLPSQFGGLKVSSLTQQGNNLYLALGGFQGITQRAGLAIVDATNPPNFTITDQWDSTAFNNGAAIARVKNGYAYLGAMQNGLVILDVSTPASIQYKSHIAPDILFGNPSNAPNARGVDIRGDTVFLAYDAGGLRAIDVTDKSNPVEIGQYKNFSVSDSARPYYNNVVVIGNYAWVPIDYCGLEVIDISNPALMTNTYLYNPWNCNDVSGNNWTDGDIHTNEIVFNPSDSIVFVSGADTEVLAFDAHNPQSPTFAGSWGVPNDSLVTWGVDCRNNQVALAMLHTIFPPVPSIKGGLTLLSYDLVTSRILPSEKEVSWTVFPNPTLDFAEIRITTQRSWKGRVIVCDFQGREIMVREITLDEPSATHVKIDLSNEGSGMYFIRIESENLREQIKFIKL